MDERFVKSAATLFFRTTPPLGVRVRSAWTRICRPSVCTTPLRAQREFSSVAVEILKRNIASPGIALEAGRRGACSFAPVFLFSVAG